MQVNRKDLLKAIDIVRKAVATSDTMPLLTHLLFDEKEITATDMDIGIVTDFPMFGGKEFLVPADRLYKLLSLLSHEVLDMELDDDGLFIKGRGHESKLATAPVPESFPRVRREFREWKIPPAKLIKSLEFCLRSISESAGAQFGAIMWGQDGFVSSDTQVVSWCKPTDGDIMPEEPVLMTSKFAKEAVRLGQPEGWVVHEGTICFLYEKTQLVGQLIGAEFPDRWRGYFPEEVPETMIPFGKEMKDTLGRIGKFSATDPIASAGGELTTIALDGKRVVLSYEDIQGKILERMKMRGAEACSFQVDSGLLAGVLTYCPKCAYLDINGRPMLYLEGETGWPVAVMSVAPVEVK